MMVDLTRETHIKHSRKPVAEASYVTVFVGFKAKRTVAESYTNINNLASLRF